jgi:hypothetical protein
LQLGPIYTAMSRPFFYYNGYRRVNWIKGSAQISFATHIAPKVWPAANSAHTKGSISRECSQTFHKLSSSAQHWKKLFSRPFHPHLIINSIALYKPSRAPPETSALQHMYELHPKIEREMPQMQPSRVRISYRLHSITAAVNISASQRFLQRISAATFPFPALYQWCRVLQTASYITVSFLLYIHDWRRAAAL